MNLIKTSEQIQGIRESSKLAARVLEYTASLLRPGISTLELNDKADKFMRVNGATPATLGYKGYPKSICTSINNVVCHGIPKSSDILKEGDIINIDVTTILNGYFGDTSATYAIGTVPAGAQQLLEVTKQSLYRAINEIKPGRYLNDCVGKVIQPYANSYGFSVVRELGGHGVGLAFHEDIFVYHYDIKKRDLLLQSGMVFTIEPMINSGKPDIFIDKNDGWTIYTADGSLSAQFEHTILVTPTGHEILTSPN